MKLALKWDTAIGTEWWAPQERSWFQLVLKLLVCKPRSNRKPKKLSDIYQKGNGLAFPNQKEGILGLLVQICDNATELRDVLKSPGKNSIFLLKM